MAKVIKLKKLGKEGESGQLDYAAMIRVIIQSPTNPQQGLTVEEIRKSVRVLEALDKAKGKLELEDADYDVLKTKVENFRFGLAHKDILTFIDDIIAVGEKDEKSKDN